ncbi:hypothetical protein TBGT1765_00315 [Thermotoga sp. TBGT1765]|uniref:hypothetical protein n=2 Tax=Thermotoga TaxID=2335 RepID=UPI0005408AA6|nr:MULTISPECIES: hypothetical protein [unclassified Thermotoga]AIY88296.1 hypothetical protein CELL2_04985 [Thermotoga sp. Cell2]KHC95892.1 hypothetical protein TBGT1765_00315 [Thermotoga sp. TBGT1765]KHC96911.1 hypothetical protein XYL54_01020 [Thermotoga sp. Xyl54]
MKKLLLVLLVVSFLLYGCLRTPPVVKEMVSVDGNLSDWGEKVKSDPTDDSKWGADNELLKAGLLFDGENVYISGEYVLGGDGNQNVFLALIDLVGVSGAQEVSYTGLNGATREFKNSQGDIDIIVEVAQNNSYKVWRVAQDGTLTEITDQVSAQFGTGSTIVELSIPITEQVDQVKAVFAISGGTGGGKQWVGDFYPNQPDHDATSDGGLTQPASVVNFVVCDSQGNVTEEINQTEPTPSEEQPAPQPTATITVDGDLSDLGTPVATSTNPGGGNGADLYQLYVTYDATYLYIGFDTQNSGSWDVAYGIGIDTKPGGYYTGDSDAWGRKISFGAGYAVDYEIYFWWAGGSGLDSNNFCEWNGLVWNYRSIADAGGTFDYTGDTSSGLQTMEIAIPWSAIGGKQDVALIVWITGGSGSAVDSIPDDGSTIDNANADEWNDSDTFTNLYLLQVN